MTLVGINGTRNDRYRYFWHIQPVHQWTHRVHFCRCDHKWIREKCAKWFNRIWAELWNTDIRPDDRNGKYKGSDGVSIRRRLCNFIAPGKGLPPPGRLTTAAGTCIFLETSAIIRVNTSSASPGGQGTTTLRAFQDIPQNLPKTSLQGSNPYSF